MFYNTCKGTLTYSHSDLTMTLIVVLAKLNSIFAYIYTYIFYILIINSVQVTMYIGYFTSCYTCAGSTKHK
jgi:hypothetical protein